MAISDKQRAFLRRIADEIKDPDTAAFLHREAGGMRGFVAHKVIGAYVKSGAEGAEAWVKSLDRWESTLGKNRR